MRNHRLETTTETRSALSRQDAERQAEKPKAQGILSLQHDPLAQVISGAGNTMSAHAATLNRATDSQPAHAGQSLRQLQRQYGNRYVQRVLAQARTDEGEASAAPGVEQAIQRARGGGQALDGGVRAQMEPAFGADFSGVRVHADAQADTLNRSLSARAFTTGQDIFFRQGAYSPGSSSGRELLAHELTHVVQQVGGARPKLTIGQSGDKRDQEADWVADGVMRMPEPRGRRQVEDGASQYPPSTALGKPMLTRELAYALQQTGRRVLFSRQTKHQSSSVVLGQKTDNVQSTMLQRRKASAKKACVKKEEIPKNHTGAMGLQGLVNDYFEMYIDWDKTGSDCDCSCGEYRQFVKGHIKINGHPKRKKLYGGAVLEENAYHEDADDQGRHPYGHRAGKNTSMDKFIDPGQKTPNRATACGYRGDDTPGVQIASGVHLDMHLVFKGQTYDRCKKTYGKINTWESKWNDPVP